MLLKRTADLDPARFAFMLWRGECRYRTVAWASASGKSDIHRQACAPIVGGSYRPAYDRGYVGEFGDTVLIPNRRRYCAACGGHRRRSELEGATQCKA